MRKIKATFGLACCCGVFAFRAAAQDAATPPMGDKMAMPMGHDHAAMMASGDVNSLLDRLNQSLAAIEAEKKPAARKEKLAAHGALLKELQAKLEAQQGGMMGMGDMKGMACCGADKGGGVGCGGMKMDGAPMKMDDEPKK